MSLLADVIGIVSYTSMKKPEEEHDTNVFCSFFSLCSPLSSDWIHSSRNNNHNEKRHKRVDQHRFSSHYYSYYESRQDQEGQPNKYSNSYNPQQDMEELEHELHHFFEHGLFRQGSDDDHKLIARPRTNDCCAKNARIRLFRQDTQTDQDLWTWTQDVLSPFSNDDEEDLLLLDMSKEPRKRSRTIYPTVSSLLADTNVSHLGRRRTTME